LSAIIVLSLSPEPVPGRLHHIERAPADSTTQSAQTRQATDEETRLRQSDARLRRTVAEQREKIRDLRHQVIQLTLAAAVLAQGQAQAAAAHPAPDSVVPLRPDSS
jgi:hypothetical protein